MPVSARDARARVLGATDDAGADAVATIASAMAATVTVTRVRRNGGRVT